VKPELPPHPVLTKYYERDADRHSFVMGLFDGAARHYDWICSLGSLGTGRRYRRDALRRAGLARGMRLLDVATGTGLVARSALEILQETGAVTGLDPSRGMLEEARKRLSIALVQGRAEELPFARDRFDVLSVGYALRHVADLSKTFGECRRVLRPGGRLLVLEMSRPRARVSGWMIRVYLQTILPLVARLSTNSAPAGLLTKYFWDTIAECVPPETILDALQRSGFMDVRRHVLGGFLSEYMATKPRA
jgi:demethylmenaquinone methyltransferase / 2-methoxy-6-polyprenyl-1,4-benzoquinol methylase